ncbi:NAD(P)-binding domain-containing protein [Ascidiaceihabitans sp.]|uniref:NAD(P)-binding domain-containing protein n=1 Tax=Ascidiaceihabitans sp. TaxID=1872644 RepID=UPI0032971906
MLLHDIRDQCVYDCAFVGKKLVDCSDWNTGALYASAYFISSKIHSYFSDFQMPDHYPNYPSNRQIFDYMKNFARHYNLYDHITFNSEVTQTTFANDVWDVTLAHGETRQYRWMVCVSGTTWHPKMPAWASQTDAFDGEVRHANSFRHMDEFRGKRVLVVGAGNSGCDIACDAAVAGDAAFINVRRGYHFAPKHIMGKPADVFGDEGPHAVQRGRCPRDAAAAFGLCLFHHVDGGDGPYERQRSVFSVQIRAEEKAGIFAKVSNQVRE